MKTVRTQTHTRNHTRTAPQNRPIPEDLKHDPTVPPLPSLSSEQTKSAESVRKKVSHKPETTHRTPQKQHKKQAPKHPKPVALFHDKTKQGTLSKQSQKHAKNNHSSKNTKAHPKNHKNTKKNLKKEFKDAQNNRQTSTLL